MDGWMAELYVDRKALTGAVGDKCSMQLLIGRDKPTDGRVVVVQKDGTNNATDGY